MNASTAALAAAFAFATAGMAAELAQLKPAESSIQSPIVSPDLGRVEVCTLAAQGNARGCQAFDAQQLEILFSGPPIIASQLPQQAFIDPVTRQLVSPTQEQLSDLLELTISEEMLSEGNAPLVTETLADGTMMVRVGKRFHAQLSVVRGGGSTPAPIKPEVEKP